MCGKTPPPAPKVIERDPIAEQKKAEADAQTTANEDAAGKRRRRSFSSTMSSAAGRSALLGGGGGASVANKTLLAQATPKP